tara:strand:- start:480 stop:680 length:201 start_codon:yes stop_codon:yes gene_type:complete
MLSEDLGGRDRKLVAFEVKVALVLVETLRRRVRQAGQAVEAGLVLFVLAEALNSPVIESDEVSSAY